MIKKFLEEELYTDNLVVLENEFGEVGIDGPILKRSGIEVREIASGCICCTLTGEFEDTIADIVKNLNPSRIIIEPSGVGKLSEVIESCYNVKEPLELMLDMVITVVDATKFDLYLANFSDFYRDQIVHAKIIVLSRVQKVKGPLQIIVESLRKINSTATIITTPLEEIGIHKMLSLFESDGYLLDKKSNHHHKSGCTCGSKHVHKHNADEVFDVWSCETPQGFDEELIKKALYNFDTGDFGFILRGKGIIQTHQGRWIQFDYVPGESTVIEAQPDYTGRLCVIGRDINKEKLFQVFGIDPKLERTTG